MPWAYDYWIFQLFGIILAGAGVLAMALGWADRSRRKHPSAEVGMAGNMPEAVGINMARVRVGGDIGGLVVVIGIILAFMPMMWGWFLVVAVGAVVVATCLFIWHRL